MTTIKYLSLIFFLFILQVRSQNKFQKDSSNVYKVMISLFDGMREGDSSKVHTTLHKKIRMYTSYKFKTGEQKLKEGKSDSFLNTVGSDHDHVWDERISNTMI